MSFVTRITLVTLLVSGAALYFVTRFQLNETVRRYREATEEPLVDIAMVLAAEVANASQDGRLDTTIIRDSIARAQSAKLRATIYDLERTLLDLQVYITDSKGLVVFDSNGKDDGKDYSQWNDVYKTLRGEYGARSSKMVGIDGKEFSILYVAAPIERDGKVLGSLTVGKSTRSGDLFTKGAKHSTLTLGITAFFACGLLAIALAFAVSAPITRLTNYAREIGDGKRPTLPKLPNGELRKLGTAFEAMRDALEGRQYVEKYVQTLAHALKSPLSGIHGAVELLKENLPSEDRARFTDNIAGDAKRMQQLLDKLLALSTLQREKSLVAAEPLFAMALLRDAVEFIVPIAAARGINITLSGDETVKVLGNKLWIHEALTNLLINAVEFSPTNSSITATIKKGDAYCEIRIEDHGPGVPEWAIEKIFDRFYSLPRPDGGSKSTGLGLSIVREVATLHGGSVSLTNGAENGAIAVLSLPITV